MSIQHQTNDLVASASITINAPVSSVWNALTDPEKIKMYMFGTEVVTDWKLGSKILWYGEWQGEAYEDKGKILAIKKGELLRFSHFSPLSGDIDAPENYHIVTFDLQDEGSQTIVSLTQSNNPTEEMRKHSEENWILILQSLKSLVEA